MFEPSLEVAGGGLDDAGRGIPGLDQRVQTVAVKVVDQCQLAQPGWADVDVVALCVFGGQPIEQGGVRRRLASGGNVGTGFNPRTRAGCVANRERGA